MCLFIKDNDGVKERRDGIYYKIVNVTERGAYESPVRSFGRYKKRGWNIAEKVRIFIAKRDKEHRTLQTRNGHLIYQWYNTGFHVYRTKRDAFKTSRAHVWGRKVVKVRCEGVLVKGYETYGWNNGIIPVLVFEKMKFNVE